MILIRKKVGPFLKREYFFADELKFLDAFRLSHYKYVSGNPSCPLFYKEKIHTIYVDLTQDDETIFSNIEKNIRREINFCINNHFDFEIVETRERFISFFNDFAILKKIRPVNRKFIDATSGCSLITAVNYQGQTLAMHYCLIDKDKKLARGIYSANIRLDTQLDPSLIGRANKFLFYKDLLYLKQLGINIYDFGGYSMDTKNKDLSGINSFKKRFGGKIEELHNIMSLPFLFVNNLIQIGKKLSLH